MRVTGINTVILNFNKIKKLTEKEIEERLSISTKIIAERARENCPVITGELKRSVHATNPVKKGNGFVSEVRAEKSYSLFVELGTSRMTARRFMGRAIDSSTNEIRKIFSSLGIR